MKPTFKFKAKSWTIDLILKNVPLRSLSSLYNQIGQTHDFFFLLYMETLILIYYYAMDCIDKNI